MIAEASSPNQLLFNMFPIVYFWLYSIVDGKVKLIFSAGHYSQDYNLKQLIAGSRQFRNFLVSRHNVPAYAQLLLVYFFFLMCHIFNHFLSFSFPFLFFFTLIFSIYNYYIDYTSCHGGAKSSKILFENLLPCRLKGFLPSCYASPTMGLLPFNTDKGLTLDSINGASSSNPHTVLLVFPLQNALFR